MNFVSMGLMHCLICAKILSQKRGVIQLEMIRNLLRRHKDVIVYLIFGVLTTAVNYLVYLPCYNAFGCSAALSNGIAWVFAVVFAFLTNKPFVFQSHDWSAETVISELLKFLGTRIGSGLLETAILFMAVDLMCGDGNIMKLVTSVLVVIINYVGSKLLVFKK